MTRHFPVPYVWQIIAFLLAVVLIVPLFKRLKLSPILGYLAVGAAIGPFALAWVPDVEPVRNLAEFGVVFLLFSLGLELSFARLRQAVVLIFGLGSAQLLLSAAVIGALAWAWGNSSANAMIIGLCMALSSTAMVAPLLQERGELASLPGRASFAVLLLQDLAVVPILILLSALGGGGHSLGQSLGMALLKGLAAIGVIGLLGRYGLRFLFRKAMASRSVDVFMAVMLLAILATSLITEMAGLSLSLGAFLAGLLLAETEFRYQIESEIEPFKGLLLGLFFMGVGMNVNLSLAFAQGFWLLASVLGLVAIKAAIAAGLARLFGLPWLAAISTGLLLAQAGEFAFVVIGQATLTYGLMDEALGQFMVVVAGLSMAITPLVIGLGRRWVRRLEALFPDQLSQFTQTPTAPHVVIAGFGRVGRAVAMVLQSESIPYVAVDMSTEHVGAARLRQEPVILGDARKPELLKKLGLGHAQAVIITMDNPQAAQQALLNLRREWPDLPVFIRSRDALHSDKLLAAGATAVVPETLEVSLQLAGSALQAVGMAREEIQSCINHLRQEGFAHWRDIEKS